MICVLPCCSLQQVASHLSNREAGLQATLILSFTLSRLERQLEPICAAWPGPLAAAVYLPVTTETDITAVDSAREYLFDLHSR